MSTYRLNTLFAPRSVAVVGASPREKSTGRAVLRNLQRGDFQGDIHLVNPNYNSIDGISAIKSYDRLSDAPDLALIAAPPQAVPGVVAAALALSRHLRPTPTARALPSGLVARRGQNWTPIRGQICAR